MNRRKILSLPAVVALLVMLGATVAYGIGNVPVIGGFKFKIPEKLTQPKVMELREQAEKLVREQSEMFWRTWIFGEPSNQAALYDQYPDLFTKDSIAKVKNARKVVQNPDWQKALEYFQHYLEAEYLSKSTAMLWDIYYDLESQEKVLVNGELVPYRDLEKYLSQAKTPEERAKLAAEEYRIYRLLNDVVLKRELEMSHRLVKDLGYDNYLQLAVEYKMIDLDHMTALAEEFLTKTEDQYLALFDEVSPIPRDQFHRSDILFVLGARDWDEYFSKEAMVPALKKTMAGLGINVDAQKNLLMHTEELPKKNPRAVCFPIVVPTDVRISIKPRGGKDDYSALFHEMGHAEHFLNAETKYWEFQQLGSNAVTEGYAYLFEGLIENPDWLKTYTNLKGDDLKKYSRHALFTNLYMMRRYMAKMLYEIRLHKGEKDPQKIYQELMSRAYGFQLTDDESLRYLSDVDPLLYSADYTQAFFIQAMLEQTLEKKFGKNWWKNKKAGQFLKDLYAFGNRLSGTEWAEVLGYPGISAKALTDKIARASK